ncbi:MAG: hypothetical protein Q9182_002331 [Xanthomendoza sp. 2 TL-2023]
MLPLSKTSAAGTTRPRGKRFLSTRPQSTQDISKTDRFSSPPPPSSAEYHHVKKSAQRDVIPLGGLERSAQIDDDAAKFKKRKQLDRELVFLQDPLKLAENTIDLLRKDDNDKALEMVRIASKHTACTVSWNHVVDYEMSKGRIQKAVKIYNEMKKRAQKPDAQTYTILLRGLSWHPHHQETVPLALKIYHSMFAENCPVKPNIIHMNAALKVCALARDMDALWGVAAKLPSKGIGAANNLTFTTILNAIRTVAWQNDKDLGDEASEEKSLRRQRAVMHGRQIWEDIVPRWMAGDLWIDEELVCAMGRLLLLGSTSQDYEDILTLVEQVMSIPRQKRPLPEPQGDAFSREQAAHTLKAAEVENDRIQEGTRDGSVQMEINADDLKPGPSVPTSTTNTAVTNVFRSQPIPPKVSLACPGRNTLSLLLDTCVRLRAIPSAQAYWGLLTDHSGPYDIAPDSENYHMYLRVLRVQRSSKAAAGLIADMYSGELAPMKMLQPKTFRIAFSAFVRDKNNPRVMEYTNKVLQIMYKALAEPDLKALEMYLEVAVARVRSDFRVTLAALRELETGTRLVRNYIMYGSDDGVVTDEVKTAAAGFAKKVIGVYDAVLHAAGDRLETGEKKDLMAEKARLSVWVQRRDKGRWERERRERSEPVKRGGEMVRRIRPNMFVLGGGRGRGRERGGGGRGDSQRRITRRNKRDM